MYNALGDIKTIYEDCKDNCNVIFFSGELGYHYILNHIHDIKIPCAFTYYETKHILSILLTFVIEHPNIPLNRVYVDFLTPLNNYMDLRNYLPASYMPYCFESRTYDYKQITQRSKELWENGKIDIILTRSINNIKNFDKLGIPYISVFPTEEMIAESINNAVNSLRLTLGSENEHITTIIKLQYDKNMTNAEREFREVSMHKLLVDTRKDSQQDFTISVAFDRFELYNQLPASTNKVPILKALVLFLQEHFAYSFRFGAGISNSVDKSHYYAETALLESIKYGDNEGFLMSGEDTAITGPLSHSQELTYCYNNKNATNYAKKYGIDESNLLKIVGLFQLDASSKLTAAKLAKALNITTRSCSRILQQLLASSLIKELPTSSQNKKGRPAKEYEFCKQAFRATLL